MIFSDALPYLAMLPFPAIILTACYYSKGFRNDVIQIIAVLTFFGLMSAVIGAFFWGGMMVLK